MKSLTLNRLTDSYCGKIYLHLTLILTLLVASILNAHATHPPIGTPLPPTTFYPTNPAKTIVLSLTFSDGSPVVYNSAWVATKPAAGCPEDSLGIAVAVDNVYAAMINTFTCPSPLTARVYNPDGTDSEETQPSADGNIIFPFAPDANQATVTDDASNTDVEVDLKPLIHDFCKTHLADPECYESDLEMESVNAITPPPLILLGKTAEITIRSIVINQGPEAKPAPPETELGVDALFNQQITNVSSGITVSPSNGVANQQEFGLKVGTSRENNQTYEVTCLEPGLHEATFTSSIEPLSAAVIEPHELDSNTDSNNSLAFVLSVDCAVPVTINNKPHSFPNSINIEKEGEIPVAVLTTEQGEYGNPLAFDAQTIDPTTVHYGIESVASFDNGATETHGTQHITDSYELDDKTKDKDLDAVMHFSVTDTGLSSGETEACIKGKFTDNSNTYTFFGCDNVNIID